MLFASQDLAQGVAQVCDISKEEARELLRNMKAEHPREGKMTTADKVYKLCNKADPHKGKWWKPIVGKRSDLAETSWCVCVCMPFTVWWCVPRMQEHPDFRPA